MILLNWKLRLYSDQFVFTPISFDPVDRKVMIVLPKATDPDFRGENIFL